MNGYSQSLVLSAVMPLYVPWASPPYSGLVVAKLNASASVYVASMNNIDCTCPTRPSAFAQEHG